MTLRIVNYLARLHVTQIDSRTGSFAHLAGERLVALFRSKAGHFTSAIFNISQPAQDHGKAVRFATRTMSTAAAASSAPAVRKAAAGDSAFAMP